MVSAVNAQPRDPCLQIGKLAFYHRNALAGLALLGDGALHRRERAICTKFPGKGLGRAPAEAIISEGQSRGVCGAAA
jgi:hypothetical protein